MSMVLLFLLLLFALPLQLFIIPNRILAKSRIENQRRSPMACVEVRTIEAFAVP